MISKTEIDQKATEFQIHTSNVMRDYVFGWLLYGLFTHSNLKDIIFLKGGNALRKGYFENTRFSKDLDLGIPGDIDQNELLAEFNKIGDYVQDKAKIIFDKDQNKVEEKFICGETPLPDLKVYEVKIYFKDFYGEESSLILKVSLDLTRFDKVICPIQKVPLLHPYSDSNEISCSINCMKLEEIIATKLKCLLQRQHAPDLFDYVYSIKLLGGSLNKEEVVTTLIKKTIFSRNPHTLKDILKNISLSYFRNYWDKAIICSKQVAINVEDAINTFVGDLDNLFSMYPDNGYGNFAYFEAKFRVPIMEAGRNQTLLKIWYKGEERIVEPYSLKYQQKRDGTEQEYFYAYKLSGGESGPGWKRFLAREMDKIENTDEKFIPRDGLLIELSKAGELPEKRYLFDPNKPSKPFSRHRRISCSNFGIKYVYRCSHCGKKFTRNSMDNLIRPHKNKNGYPCYGGYGIYSGTKR